MRKAIFIGVMGAAAMAFTACSDGGNGDGSGSGGSGGSGGTAGTGGGSTVAISFDETTSIPATAGSAAAMAAATRFGETLAAIFELASASDASTDGVSPKVLIPGFCASGEADLVVPPGPPTGWGQGDQIVLTLTSCEGSVLSPSSVSGEITIDIETVMLSAPDLRLDVAADVSLVGGATIDGTFAAVVFVGIGGISVRLGKQLDDDDLSISDGTVNLALGCFDILVSLASNKTIAPLAVAKLGNQVYTINDYTQSPLAVILDENGVPSAGTLVMNPGDNSAATGSERSGPCPGFGTTSMDPPITATISEGGCIELSGAVNQTTSWAKLLAGDLSPGGGEGCDGMSETPAMAPAVSCPASGDIVASADAYVRGGTHASTSFASASNLLLKGDFDLEYARKVYLSFDLAAAPAFTQATLVVTLDRHVSATPQACDLSGVIDNDDWDPSNATWSDADRNDVGSAIAFEDQGLGASAGVRKLVRGYDFERTDIAASPDPSGTQYAFDVTEFVQWALGQNNGYSDAANQDDDGIVTLLLALSAASKEDGLSLRSLENQDGGDDCDQPFLHFQ